MSYEFENDGNEIDFFPYYDPSTPRGTSEKCPDGAAVSTADATSEYREDGPSNTTGVYARGDDLPELPINYAIGKHAPKPSTASIWAAAGLPYTDCSEPASKPLVKCDNVWLTPPPDVRGNAKKNAHVSKIPRKHTVNPNRVVLPDATSDDEGGISIQQIEANRVLLRAKNGGKAQQQTYGTSRRNETLHRGSKQTRGSSSTGRGGSKHRNKVISNAQKFDGATGRIVAEEISNLSDQLAASKDVIKELVADKKDDAVVERERKIKADSDARVAFMSETLSTNNIVFHEPLLPPNHIVRRVTNFIMSGYMGYVPFVSYGCQLIAAAVDAALELFPVKHTYELSDEQHHLPLEMDVRPHAMSHGEVTEPEPLIARVDHKRSLVFLYDSPYFTMEYDVLQFPDRKFDISMNILCEATIPKNISAFESPSTACSRLRYTANAMHNVNYNKYSTAEAIDLHTNSLVVAYGIYKHGVELHIASPFYRDPVN